MNINGYLSKTANWTLETKSSPRLAPWSMMHKFTIGDQFKRLLTLTEYSSISCFILEWTRVRYFLYSLLRLLHSLALTRPGSSILFKKDSCMKAIAFSMINGVWNCWSKVSNHLWVSCSKWTLLFARNATMQRLQRQKVKQYDWDLFTNAALQPQPGSVRFLLLTPNHSLFTTKFTAWQIWFRKSKIC